MSDSPKAWNMSNPLLIAASDIEWQTLWREHLTYYKRQRSPPVEFQLVHARLDRIRLERMLQALRYKTMTD